MPSQGSSLHFAWGETILDPNTGISDFVESSDTVHLTVQLVESTHRCWPSATVETTFGLETTWKRRMHFDCKSCSQCDVALLSMAPDRNSANCNMFHLHWWAHCSHWWQSFRHEHISGGFTDRFPRAYLRVLCVEPWPKPKLPNPCA